MRQKGISIILVFWAVFFVYVGLSMGGWEAVRQVFDQTDSEQDQKDETVSTEDEVDVNSRADIVSDPVDLDLLDVETRHEDADISFDGQNVQNTIEKLKTEKKVETPPPLVIEEKYSSSSGEGALSEGGIVLYTNKERNKEGLASLEQNYLLTQAARAKLNHMFDEQYFEHVAPTGEDVAFWTDNVVYEYIKVGENLALGNFQSSEDMVTAWMNSPGHRANILKKGYTEIGVATGFGEFDNNEVWLGVQIFAIPLSDCPEVDEILKVQIDMYEALVKEVEETLNSLQSILPETPPETQEEYEEQLVLVEQYNKLVVKHNSVIENLRFTVESYNEQVKAFNACISAK